MISPNNHGIKCDHDSARGQHQENCFVSEMTDKEKLMCFCKVWLNFISNAIRFYIQPLK